MDLHQELQNALRRRRESLAITQAHLADLSGVSLRTVAEIERGNGNPSLMTICKLADVLGVDLRLMIKKP